MGIDPSSVPTWVLLVTLTCMVAVVGGLALWAWHTRGRRRWRRAAPPGGEHQEPELHTRHQWE